MTRRIAGCFGLLIAAAAVLGACSPDIVATPRPSAASPAPVDTPPITIPSQPAGTPVTLPSGAAVTQRDPTLLDILPSNVGGVAITEEPQSFTEAINDRAFVASIDRAVFVIAVSGNNLTSGVVAHVRPGVYSEKMFLDWRSSYDQGACAQSGSVVSHAQVSNAAGATTYVTTCGGGLRVFHTYLSGKGVIISLFSTGDRDFGGSIMSQLKG